MRRCLVHRPDEVRCISRMLDLVGHGADGHGPVHLLPISAADLPGMGNSTPPTWDAGGAESAFSERYFLGLAAQS